MIALVTRIVTWTLVDNKILDTEVNNQNNEHASSSEILLWIKRRAHTNAADIAIFMRMSFTVDLENLQEKLVIHYQLQTGFLFSSQKHSDLSAL